TATCENCAGIWMSRASKTTEPSGFTMRDVRGAKGTPSYASWPAVVKRRGMCIEGTFLARTNRALVSVVATQGVVAGGRRRHKMLGQTAHPHEHMYGSSRRRMRVLTRPV